MSAKPDPHTYPQYYNIDDVPVVLEEDGDYVVGKVANGRPYPIGKAIVDGYQITKEEYARLAKQLYDINIP
jgi:hypothetical protein